MATGDLPKAGSSFAILDLFPSQGNWREGDYFSLPGNRIVELVRGHVEVLPVPSMLHQFISRLLFLWINEFVDLGKLGIVMQAPTRVRIDDRYFREPDILFVCNRNRYRHQAQYWETIDLAVEVISPDDPDRDLVDKRADYARAGIPEYWIVDARDDSIEVLELVASEYRLTNQLSRTAMATSLVLPGLTIDVRRLFAKARSS